MSSIINLLAHASSDLRRNRSLAVLTKVLASDIAETHPVRLIDDEYRILKSMCSPEFLPDVSEFMTSIGNDLAEYCIGLSPIEGDPFLDFEVLGRGNKVIGGDSFIPGRLYAQQIAPEMLEERLMELASCMALKRSRLTFARSAFRTAMNVKVYRGAFPVWNSRIGRHTVVLAIAPVYVGAQKTHW